MICAAASLTGSAHLRQQAQSQFADTPPFILTTPLAGQMQTSVKVLPIPTGLAAMIIILKVLITHKKDGVAQADHIMLL